jgi:hypothetical protein
MTWCYKRHPVSTACNPSAIAPTTSRSASSTGAATAPTNDLVIVSDQQACAPPGWQCCRQGSPRLSFDFASALRVASLLAQPSAGHRSVEHTCAALYQVGISLPTRT